MDNVYDKIKTLGGIPSNQKDDKDLQLIKVNGKANINEIRNILNKQKMSVINLLIQKINL